MVKEVREFLQAKQTPVSSAYESNATTHANIKSKNFIKSVQVITVDSV